MSGASLVIQTSFLGDTVLTTPLIAELARRGPVDVVATPAGAALLANDPSIGKLYIYDKRGRDSGALGLLRLARTIARDSREVTGDRRSPRDERTAYLAQGSVRSASLALLAGFRRRIGFDSSPACALYTLRIPYDRSVHHAERLWRLANAGRDSAAPEMPPPRLHPGEAERAAVDALLGTARDDRPFVALAPGSVWGTKRWPYYPELAARMARRCRLAIVGSADDSDAARHIVRAADAQGVVDATGKLSLLASAELIGRADLLVTNDSSPQHLASAMATPTITIFGPTVPAFGFGPLAPHSTTLGHPSLPCRPCHHHGPPTCPLGHWKCMRELGVEVVEGEVERILEEAMRDVMRKQEAESRKQ
ncbi:MAG TPA: glycosyltransferase family 9 protein [Gemmatimonadaceae bacterium]|nr:glycosyltransferase family 9 protein [Gemmatimonadaceae bacterium]